jgi:ankyrin repeat protein
MLAARTGNTELMQLLLEKGVDVKAKDKKGRTALQVHCTDLCHQRCVEVMYSG